MVCLPGGVLLGFYNDANGSHYFLYSGGNFTPLIVTGAESITGINDSGQIVGYTGNNSGFVYSAGAFTTFNDPLADYATQPTGINDAGQIVGNYYPGDTNLVSEGFLDNGGVFTKIEPPDARFYGTQANGINNSGQIVGDYTDGTVYSNGPLNPPTFIYLSFLYSGGTYTAFTDPSASTIRTFATGINDAGQIVGYYFDATGLHGFLDSGGIFTNFDDPLAYQDFTEAMGINDSGQIVGNYEDPNGSYHIFLATPTSASPEPPTLLMFVGTLVGTAGFRVRKWLPGSSATSTFQVKV